MKTLCSAAIALSTLTMLMSQAQVQAATLTGSSGVWVDPSGGGETIQYATVANENIISWGIAPTGGVQSGLGFTGVGATAIAFETPFLVGTLRHFNNPIFAPSLGSADLRLTLNLLPTGSVSLSKQFTFRFEIDETPNDLLPCPYASVGVCADKISFLNATASESFKVAGTTYTLELLGFSDRPTTSGTLVDDFISQENRASTAFLFGQLTAVSASTPEPGLIGGLAAIVIGLILRRKKA